MTTFSVDHADRAEPVLDRWRVALLATGIILSSVVYSFHLSSFLHAKEAVFSLFLILFSLVSLLGRSVGIDAYRAFFPLLLWLGQAVLFRVLLFPAHVPSSAIERTVLFFLFVIAGMLAFDLMGNKTHRDRLLNAIVASAVGVALLALIQYARLAPGLFPEFESYPQRAYSVFGNQDLLGGYMAMAAPLCVNRLMTKQRGSGYAFASLSVLIPALLLSGCRSAWLACAIGVIVAVLLSDTPRIPLPLLTGILLVACITVLLAPEPTSQRLISLATGTDAGRSLRVWFWDGALRMFVANPIVGVGLGNFAYWSPLFLGKALYAPMGERLVHNEVHTEHAHSEPLQFLAETGIVGAICLTWMLVRLLRCTGPEWSALISLLVFSLFNSTFHCISHAIAAMVLAGSLLQRRKEAESIQAPEQDLAPVSVTTPENPSWYKGLLVASATILCSVFYAWAVIVPSALLRAAEISHTSGHTDLTLYQKAVSYPWPNALANFRYGIALAEADREDRASTQIAIAQKGLDTGDVYLIKAALALRANNQAEARDALASCVERWPTNEDAWILLFRSTPSEHHRAIRELASRWFSKQRLDELAHRGLESRERSSTRTESADPNPAVEIRHEVKRGVRIPRTEI